MNKDSYAKLPDAAKKAIDTYSGEPLTKKLGGGGIQENKSVIEKLKAMPGHTYAELQGAEKERWRKLFEPITETWVKETPDGAKVLAAFRQEVDKVRKEGMR
jgi:TRAP-type C4-dicarboxylate transport system substrate-binding protein